MNKMKRAIGKLTRWEAGLNKHLTSSQINMLKDAWAIGVMCKTINFKSTKHFFALYHNKSNYISMGFRSGCNVELKIAISRDKVKAFYSTLERLLVLRNSDKYDSSLFEHIEDSIQASFNF
jgi:hypothetical protein